MKPGGFRAIVLKESREHFRARAAWRVAGLTALALLLIVIVSSMSASNST